MRKFIRFFAVMVMLNAGIAFAHDYTVGTIRIDHPWSRATVAGIPNGAAYFVLENNGKEGDSLLSVSTPAADRAELHTHLKDGEVMRMRQVDAIDVPAGGATALEPGGFHVMLFDLKEPLQQGSSFPLTLVFDKAGSVTVDVIVDLAGHKKSSGDSADHSHH